MAADRGGIASTGSYVCVKPAPLAPAGPAKGHVTVFCNGKVYRGNPRNIPLADKAQIQLDVGTPLIAPDLIAFPKSL